MAFSPSGKILWLCPNCRSAEIEKVMCFRQLSFNCLRCLHWGPWRDRIKLSIKKFLKGGDVK